MKILLRLVCLLLVLPGITISNVMAASNPDIQIRNGYVRGLPSSSVNTSAYMTLVNRSDSEVIFTGASSPVANSIMLHNTVNRDGQMSMEHVMSATIGPGKSLELKSGGMHLMLMDLKTPVRSGNLVELTLQFAGDLEQTINLPVISVLDE